jgi:orotate phosphoribosyltransferase-like protein
MPKVSKAQKYAIQFLQNKGLSVDAIAADLNLSIKQIDGVLAEEQTDTNISTESSSNKSKTLPDNFIINKTAAKGNPSVAILTQQASMLFDDIKKSNKHTNKYNDQKFIFKPKG